MATLYITELRHVEMSNGSVVPIALLPAIASQTVTIAGASAASSALNASTRFVRLATDTACHVEVSTSATVAKLYLPADAVEYFAVPASATINVIAH